MRNGCSVRWAASTRSIFTASDRTTPQNCADGKSTFSPSTRPTMASAEKTHCRWLSHAPHRQADGRSQRPLSSMDHGQRKRLIWHPWFKRFLFLYYSRNDLTSGRRQYAKQTFSRRGYSRCFSSGSHRSMGRSMGLPYRTSQVGILRLFRKRFGPSVRENGKFSFQLGYTPVVSDMKKIVRKAAASSFPTWTLAVWDMNAATLYMVKYDRSHWFSLFICDTIRYESNCVALFAYGGDSGT